MSWPDKITVAVLRVYSVLIGVLEKTAMPWGLGPSMAPIPRAKEPEAEPRMANAVRWDWAKTNPYLSVGETWKEMRFHFLTIAACHHEEKDKRGFSIVSVDFAVPSKKQDRSA